MSEPYTSEVRVRWDKWEIVARPYLDTDMPDFVRAGNEELAARGIRGFRLRAMRVFAGCGLWWNALWWKWGVLTLGDILFGWALNLALVLSLMVAFWLHWAGGLVFLIVLYPLLRLAVRVVLRTQENEDTQL